MKSIHAMCIRVGAKDLSSNSPRVKLDLRTMTKAGNDCPRSVTYPQQDQNQLDGNDRVSVVCVESVNVLSYEHKLAR